MHWTKFERMVEYVAKYAAFGEDADDPILGTTERTIIKKVGEAITEWRDGRGYCNICGGGPYRPVGLLNHIRRVHGAELEDVIEAALATGGKGLENYLKKLTSRTD